MSKLDKAFIKKLLALGDIKEFSSFRSRLSKEMFDAEGNKMYFYIEEYFTKYNALPSLEMFYESTSADLDVNADGELKYYYDELRARLLHSKLKEKLLEVQDKMAVGDPHSAYHILEDSIFTLRKEEVVDFKSQSLFKVMADIEAKYESVKNKTYGGIMTPWDTINTLTGGWNPGDFVVVASRPGIGKSWFLILMSECAWKDDKKVLFVSLELAGLTVATRFISAMMKVPYSEVRHGRLSEFAEKKFFTTVNEYIALDDGRYNILGGSGFGGSIADVETAIIEHKPDIVFIDGFYLLEIGGHGYERYERISSLADETKKMAMRYGVPIVVTHQFNRTVRSDKLSGTLDDVSMSDIIGMNADWGFGLFQDKDMVFDKKMLVRALKTRESERMEDLKLVWNFDTMTFVENEFTARVIGGDVPSVNVEDDEEYAF